MPLKRISLTTFVGRLNRSLAKGDLACLAGAGISMPEPASLPSGHALKDMAIGALCSGTELSGALQAIRRNPRYRAITPEIVFQRLYATLGQGTLAPFFDVLRHAQPNDLHRLLNTLSRTHGCRLLTTNFDGLIESARPRLRRTPIHLHGEVRRPSTMITRINQVGRGLAPSLQALLLRELKGRTLCVMGYSGSDNDIVTALGDSDVSRILWLVRDRRDPAWRCMPRLARRHTLLVAQADFETLMRRMDRNYRPTTEVLLPKAAVARRRIVERWSLRPRLVDRYACLSEVLFEIEDYHGALRLSRRALRSARGTELAGWFRIQIADALKILGRFAEAEAIVRDAIRINTRLGDLFDIAGAYNNYGVLLVEKKRPEPVRALRALHRALSVVDEVDLRACTRRRREALRVLGGRILNNLGLAYDANGDATNAIAFYSRALTAKQRSGDVLGEAKTAGNLSIVAGRARNWALADRWRDHAFGLMDRYDLRFDKAYVLRRNGAILCSGGRKREGQRLLADALALYNSIDGASFGIYLTKAALKKCK
jgi:tetratricopeptide (TPR) repeat protein